MRNGDARSFASAGVSAGGPAAEQLPDTRPWVQTPYFCLCAGQTLQFHNLLVEDDTVTADARACCTRAVQPLFMQPCPTGHPPSRGGGSHAGWISSMC